MKQLHFNFLFFLLVVPIKLIDIAISFPMKFKMFIDSPIQGIVYNLDDIIQFTTIGNISALPLIILITISIFRFKKIGMSGWYSLGLIIPIWNIYLIYKLIFSKNNIKQIVIKTTISKIKILEDGTDPIKVECK